MTFLPGCGIIEYREHNKTHPEREKTMSNKNNKANVIIPAIGRDREGSAFFFKAFHQKNHGDRTKYSKADRAKNSVRDY